MCRIKLKLLPVCVCVLLFFVLFLFANTNSPVFIEVKKFRFSIIVVGADAALTFVYDYVRIHEWFRCDKLRNVDSATKNTKKLMIISINWLKLRGKMRSSICRDKVRAGNINCDR